MMQERNSAYLSWQNPETREWHVVGMLEQRGGLYYFNYTNGAKASNKFIPFSGMDDIYATYVSNELFPLFKNRLLSERRPEYPSFIKWLKLETEEVNPINILSRSGATRGTDQLQMFKRIEIEKNGYFEHAFFAHGLSHLADSALTRTLKLQPNEQLFLCLDLQNSYDKKAVLIRAEKPAEIVGYCPRYLAKDIGDLLLSKTSTISIHVEMLSNDAPVNYRLMCKLQGVLGASDAKKLMSQSEFQSISHSSLLVL